MATENIVKGLAYRIKAATEGVWDKCSFWTSSDDVFYADNNSAEYKTGAINGITDALDSEDSSIAASSVAVKTLNDRLKTVKTYVGADGKLHFVDSEGADSVLPFSNVKNRTYKCRHYYASNVSGTASDTLTLTMSGSGTFVCMVQTQSDYGAGTHTCQATINNVAVNCPQIGQTSNYNTKAFLVICDFTNGQVIKVTPTLNNGDAYGKHFAYFYSY